MTDKKSEDVKSANDTLAKMLQVQMDKRQAEVFAMKSVCDPTPLSVEMLTTTRNKLNRELNCVYIVSSNAIPDDAYGILMLRPEDAERWGKK